MGRLRAGAICRICGMGILYWYWREQRVFDRAGYLVLGYGDGQGTGDARCRRGLWRDEAWLGGGEQARPEGTTGPDVLGPDLFRCA